MSSFGLAVEPSDHSESRKPPISNWLQLVNFGTVAILSLIAFKIYLALKRFYKWITVPTFNFEDVQVVLILGPKTELNNALVRRISEKFHTPVTLLDYDEATPASANKHLIYGGNWTPENQQDVSRLSAFIRSRYGTVDVLLVSDMPTHATPSTFLSQLNQQLLTQFWIAMAFLPGMLERNKGAIVSIAMGSSTLANAGVMRTIYEDILQKETKVTLTLVEKNTFLSRFAPALPADFLSAFIVDSIGHHSIFQIPSIFHYLFQLPQVVARAYLKPFLDYFQRPRSAPIAHSQSQFIQNVHDRIS